MNNNYLKWAILKNDRVFLAYSLIRATRFLQRKKNIMVGCD